MSGKSEDRNLDKQNFGTNYFLLPSLIVYYNSHDQIYWEIFKLMVLSSKQAPPDSFFDCFTSVLTSASESHTIKHAVTSTLSYFTQ